MCARKDPPREIAVIAYEVDPALLEYLRETLDACRALCEHAAIEPDRDS
jgi:hypothetical protein